MASIRIKFDDQNMGRKFEVAVRDKRAAILNAVNETLHDIGEEILDRGRADISGAGNFGQRWTEGLQAAEDFGPNNSSVNIFHTVPYWRIFEHGGTIQGRPLLWIPLSGTDAEGTLARDYGGLFRINSKSGLPLLMSKSDKQPKYFGKESVHIPQKFHIRDIIRDVASRMRDIFKSNVG